MYVKVTGPSSAIEYSFAQLRADNPDVSFPVPTPESTLATYDVFPVTENPPPVYDEATEKLVRGPFVLNGSTWEVSWVVTPKTPEEIAEYAKETARKEDIELMKSDPQVLALLKARPDQIDTYVENQVTDLASAKTLLKVLSRASSVLAHSIIN